jgi:hypothetical protein
MLENTVNIVGLIVGLVSMLFLGFIAGNIFITQNIKRLRKALAEAEIMEEAQRKIKELQQ